MITWRRKKDGHVGLCHLRLDTGEGWRGGSGGGGGTWLPGTELAAPPTLAITTERLPLLTTAPSALKANVVRPLCPRLLGDEPLSRPALLAGPKVRVSRVLPSEPRLARAAPLASGPQHRPSHRGGFCSRTRTASLVARMLTARGCRPHSTGPAKLNGPSVPAYSPESLLCVEHTDPHRVPDVATHRPHAPHCTSDYQRTEHEVPSTEQTQSRPVKSGQETQGKLT